jgi:hypothetical protein
MLRTSTGTLVHALRERRLAGSSAAALAVELNSREPAATVAEKAELFRQAFGLSSATAELAARADSGAEGATGSELELRLGRPGNAGALVGAVLGDGRFSVVRCLSGLNAAGLFAGHSLAPRAPILLTASPPQSATHDVTENALSPHAAASVQLLWLGPYAPGHVLIEAPPGSSARERWVGAQPAADVSSVITGLAAAAEAAHADGRTLQGIRPETLGVDAATGQLWWSARAERLLAGAAPRQGTAAWFERTYRAPDTSDVQPVSPASDVFTLAVLAAEWLHGRHPFEAPTPALHYLSVLSSTLAFDPGPVPRRAFSRNPKDRPSLRAFVAELDAALG